MERGVGERVGNGRRVGADELGAISRHGEKERQNHCTMVARGSLVKSRTVWNILNKAK